MPQHQYEGEYGNMYVELQIVLPPKLTDEQREGEGGKVFAPRA